ncbi:MAG: hypothetical protein CW345_05985 [Firmicutes bacterium]|nr:hypothetical protein [Bacillota bacterium]MBO2521335.1 hypothetical protein [Bacillota bacterium]
MEVTPLLRLEAVTLSYRGESVLRDIDFSIPAGAMLGLIGPNGAGKSSLIKVAAGLVRPTKGQVTYQGRPLHSLDERERGREIAVMSQNPEMGFGFRVYDVVAMGRYPHRRRFQPLGAADHGVIREVMEITGVWELRERLLPTLSGGERQRVFLARALAQSPKLLFLDEPTANLDIRYQLEILQIIRRLNRERGITVVLAIHDLTLALRACDDVAVLTRGRLAAAGPAACVLTEELVRDVFGVDARVGRDPETGTPRVDYVSVI